MRAGTSTAPAVVVTGHRRHDIRCNRVRSVNRLFQCLLWCSGGAEEFRAGLRGKSNNAWTNWRNAFQSAPARAAPSGQNASAQSQTAPPRAQRASTPFVIAYSVSLLPSLGASATEIQISVLTLDLYREASGRTESKSCLCRRHWRYGIRRTPLQALQLRFFHKATDDARR